MNRTVLALWALGAVACGPALSDVSSLGQGFYMVRAEGYADPALAVRHATLEARAFCRARGARVVPDTTGGAERPFVRFRCAP